MLYLIQCSIPFMEVSLSRWQGSIKNGKLLLIDNEEPQLDPIKGIINQEIQRKLSTSSSR